MVGAPISIAMGLSMGSTQEVLEDLITKAFLGRPCTAKAVDWAAVKELNVDYHNMDICQIIWFLDYGT